MNSLVLRILTVFVFFAVLPASALAQSCFLGNCAEPVGQGVWEVQFGLQYDDYKDARFLQAPRIEVNYGLTPDFQLHVMAPFQYADVRGVDSRYGFGDMEFGAVYRFIQENVWLPQFSVYPLVVTPTGDEKKGLGTGEVEVFVPIWFKKGLGAWELFGGGGFWINSGAGNENFWETRVGLEHAFSDRWKLGFELYHYTPERDDWESRTGFNVGAALHLDRMNHLLFTVGRDFDDVKRASVNASYVLTFGR
ncbi:MAG: transporter [Desulfobacteraceae bacterium]|nr:transporter [Desulfobacteraceae bacterium]